MSLESTLKLMKLETLLLLFFNTTQNKDNDFEIQSKYRKSKFLSNIEPDYSYKITCENLIKKYNINFSIKDSVTICAIIKNTDNLNLDTFLNLVYNIIIIKIVNLEKNYPFDVECALALFILRGSADFNRNLYSVDIKNVSQLYFDNLFKILLSSDVLLNKLNLNFRELQQDYINGRERNTQIRINLRWFYDNVMDKYIYLNPYKGKILLENKNIIGSDSYFSSFEERIIFYKKKILNRELSKYEINDLRNELNFQQNTSDKKISRNQKIVIYAREVFDDICVGCSDKYDIKDRSFKIPKTNRYYLEINHVLPFANDPSQIDVLDNLVKLCPVCHRALAPGRAEESLQIDIINKMIHSRKEIEYFINNIKPNNMSDVEFIFNNLK